MAIVVTAQTITDADAYFATRVNSSAWSDEADKLAALTTAANLLNSLNWRGTASSTLSAFPRIINGVNMPIPPSPVLNALYEQALHLLNNSELLFEEGTAESVVFGPISVQEIKNAPFIPKLVYRYLLPFLNGNGNAPGRSWWRAN